MLWHWAKRRHPDKYKNWIANKYWHSDGNRRWVFSEGDKQLNLLSETKIVRHRKLKLDVNPYLDKGYFVSRKIKLRIEKLTTVTNKVRDKAKNELQLETETMKNNCCPS